MAAQERPALPAPEKRLAPTFRAGAEFSLFPDMTFPDQQTPLLMIISGPAGCGKTTLCQRLVDDFEEAERIITCTTRGPRPGEVDGEDYYFFSDEQFQGAIDRGEFLEWAAVHGARYGTLRRTVFERLRARLGIVLNIDVQGAAAFRAAAREDALLKKSLVTVFILPSSPEVLRERMRERGADDEAVIERRLANAKEEMSRWGDYDFCVVSGAREADYRQVASIWIAEKRRVSRLRH